MMTLKLWIFSIRPIQNFNYFPLQRQSKLPYIFFHLAFSPFFRCCYVGGIWMVNKRARERMEKREKRVDKKLRRGGEWKVCETRLRGWWEREWVGKNFHRGRRRGWRRFSIASVDVLYINLLNSASNIKPSSDGLQQNSLYSSKQPYSLTPSPPPPHYDCLLVGGTRRVMEKKITRDGKFVLSSSKGSFHFGFSPS